MVEFAITKASTRWPVRRGRRLEKFYAGQLRLLDKIRFDAISQAGKVDYLLIRGRLLREQKQAGGRGRRERNRGVDSVPADHRRFRRSAAADGDHRCAEIRAGAGKAGQGYRRREGLESGAKANPASLNRAAQRLEQFAATLRNWYDFYELYDPKFVWWMEVSTRRRMRQWMRMRSSCTRNRAWLARSTQAAGGAAGGRAVVAGTAAVAEGARRAAAVRWEVTKNYREWVRPATMRW